MGEANASHQVGRGRRGSQRAAPWPGGARGRGFRVGVLSGRGCGAERSEKEEGARRGRAHERSPFYNRLTAGEETNNRQSEAFEWRSGHMRTASAAYHS